MVEYINIYNIDILSWLKLNTYNYLLIKNVYLDIYIQLFDHRISLNDYSYVNHSEKKKFYKRVNKIRNRGQYIYGGYDVILI